MKFTHNSFHVWHLLETGYLVLALLAFAGFVSAQEGSPDTLSLTLEQAVTRALNANPTLLRAEATLENSRGTYDKEQAQWTPKFDASVSNRRTHSESAQLITQTQTTLGTPITQSTLSSSQDTDSLSGKIGLRDESILLGGNLGRLTSRADLFNVTRDISENLGDETKTYTLGPSINLSLKHPLTRVGKLAEGAPLTTARTNATIAELDYLKAKQDALFEVVSAYYALVKALRASEVAAEGLKQTAGQLEIARVQQQLGAKAEIDALKLEVQLAQDKNKLIEAESQITSANQTLALALGEEPSKQILPTTIPSYQAVDVDVDKATSEALTQRIELQQLALKQDLNRLSLATAQSGDRPYLTLDGTYTLQGQGQTLGTGSNALRDDNLSQWVVGATLTLPLDDGGTTQAAVRQALANETDTRVALESTQRTIRREVQEAAQQLQSAEQRYQILSKSLAVASESVKIDQLRFARGLIRSIDLQQSQLALTQVSLDASNALIDYFLNQYKLYKAQGSLLAALGVNPTVDAP